MINPAQFASRFTKLQHHCEITFARSGPHHVTPSLQLQFSPKGDGNHYSGDHYANE
jgi:hypothetical protein